MTSDALSARPGYAKWPTLGQHRPVSVRLLAALVTGLGTLLVVKVGASQVVEAHLNAALMGLSHLGSAQAVRQVVIFPVAGQFVAYTVTAECTAALLAAPFFFVTALLLAASRLPVRRCLVALAVVTIGVLVANQARLLVIAGAMQLWGAKVGYERGHVLLGTIVSTVGVLAAIFAYVRILVHGRSGTKTGPQHSRQAGKARG